MIANLSRMTSGLARCGALLLLCGVLFSDTAARVLHELPYRSSVESCSDHVCACGKDPARTSCCCTGESVAVTGPQLADPCMPGRGLDLALVAKPGLPPVRYGAVVPLHDAPPTRFAYRADLLEGVGRLPDHIPISRACS